MKPQPVLSAITMGALIAAANVLPASAVTEEDAREEVVETEAASPAPEDESAPEPVDEADSHQTDSIDEPEPDEMEHADDEAESDPEDQTVVEYFLEATQTPEPEPRVEIAVPSPARTEVSSPANAEGPSPANVEGPATVETFNSPAVAADVESNVASNDRVIAEVNNQTSAALPATPAPNQETPEALNSNTSNSSNSSRIQDATDTTGPSPFMSNGSIQHVSPLNVSASQARDFTVAGMQTLSQTLLGFQETANNSPIQERTTGPDGRGRVESQRISQPNETTEDSPIDSLINADDLTDGSDTADNSADDLATTDSSYDSLATTGSMASSLAMGAVLLVAVGTALVLWGRNIHRK